jgi:hypothetical protein
MFLSPKHKQKKYEDETKLSMTNLMPLHIASLKILFKESIKLIENIKI